MGRALAVIIWILTLLSVSLFFVNKWWFPTAISSHAAALDRQFIITIIVVGLAFTAAQVGLGFMVWKYREDATRSRAVYTHGSSRLEVCYLDHRHGHYLYRIGTHGPERLGVASLKQRATRIIPG